MIRLSHILNEIKTGNDFIDFLLQKIQPVINNIILLQKQKAQKDGEKFSKYDEEFAELTLKYDLLKALGNYTKPSDTLIKGSVSTSNKGSLTIDAVIERDGVEYPLYTEVIYAGGYNIQKLHFRYLTKTKLLRSHSNPEADKVKAELAKLSKGERLQKEIETHNKRIEQYQNIIDTNSKFTDKQILAKVNAGDNVSGKPYQWPSWKEIVKRGAASNYNNDENYFNKRKSEAEEESIYFFKKKNIEWPTMYIKDAKKAKERLEKQLNALV
jgi:hypothetical protein